MKNYYILTSRNTIDFVGEFNNFAEAWDYISYDMERPFVWLLSENSLRELSERIDVITKSP